MIEFDLINFPKFVEQYKHSTNTWLEDLKNDGYNSTYGQSVRGNYPKTFLMEEVEYTHFVLKWS